MAPDSWEFYNATRIVFGEGRLDQVAKHVTGRALVVTTRGATSRGLTQRITDVLDNPIVFDGVESNPTIAAIDGAIAKFRGTEVSSIVGVGGGSAIDVSKVLSVALAAPQVSVARWVESAICVEEADSLRLVAIPTTAGTGSEVTPFATVWDGVTKRKHSVGTPQMLPDVAIVDPRLSTSMPWSVSLSTGLDALSQCAESIMHRRPVPVATALAEHGLRWIPPALRKLASDPSAMSARSAMSRAALFSGLAISATRTGLAHAMSYPLTAHLGMPHGLACGAMLPGVLAFNSEVGKNQVDAIDVLIGGDGVGHAPSALLDLYGELGVGHMVRQFLPAAGIPPELAPEMLDPTRAANSIRTAGLKDIQRILDFTSEWLNQMAAPA